MYLVKNLCPRIFQEIYQSWNSNILKIDRSNGILTKRRILTPALLLNITVYQLYHNQYRINPVPKVAYIYQELLTLPEHLCLHPLLLGFALLVLKFYVYVLQIVVCPFVLFLLAIELSVLLRFTDSDYHFGIFKLFLWAPHFRKPHMSFLIMIKVQDSVTHKYSVMIAIVYTSGHRDSI